MRVFRAKYGGRCCYCRNEIARRDLMVIFDSNRMYHWRCREEEQKREHQER